MNRFDQLESRVLCLFGALDDVFCENNLRIVSFNNYLSAYLKSAGFETVVFYLSSGAMRTFDDFTARTLIGENRLPAEEASNPDDPEEAEGDDEDLDFDLPLPSGDGAAPTQEPEYGAPSGAARKLKYWQFVSGADFLPIMQQLLADTSRRSAVIFENIRDFLNVNAECSDQFKTVLHYLRSDGSERQQNVVIFQSLSPDYSQLLQEMQENDILQNNFFRVGSQGAVPIESRFLRIGSPGVDEVANLLEHFRLFGDGKGRHLSYPASQLRPLAFLLRQAGELSGSASLLGIVQRLQAMLNNARRTLIPFDRSSIVALYPDVRLRRLPLERLDAIPQAWEVSARLRSLSLPRRRSQSPAEVNLCHLQRFPFHRSALPTDNRFLVLGISNSGRSAVAQAICEQLYLMGAVGQAGVRTVTRSELLGALQGSIALSLEAWIHEAGDGILLLDDLEVLTDLPDPSDSDRVIELFHRTLLEALRRNTSLSFLLVLHSAEEERFFRRHPLTEYAIPQRNRFQLTPAEERETPPQRRPHFASEGR